MRMSKHRSISEWAMANGYTQCMGCKGFSPSDTMLWRQWSGTVMPYCTEECVEVSE